MSNHFRFELKPLPYSFDALEPYIDAKTMEIHHDRHHKTYVDNLNKSLEEFPDFQNKSLEELLSNVEKLPEGLKNPVINFGGGTYNHEIYFDGMLLGHHFPIGELKKAIELEFGGLDKFKEEFKKLAMSVFGSGFAWLVKNKEGKLLMMKTANQNSPSPLQYKPILALDVWEHAYYIKYQNKRADYIDNWFHVINWDIAEKKFQGN